MIESKDKTLKMGSNDSLVNSSELGETVVGFSYDFQIDTVEVTRREFNSVMGWAPPVPSGVNANEDIPVSMVTWYDAVLFCNQKSKAENLDTVYDYLAFQKSGGGSTHSMSGLTRNLDRNGYRLPTEAEWEFSAKGPQQFNWVWGNDTDSVQAGDHAWYSANSKAKLHPVATKKPNAFGLHDMAGNLYEWVNDWLSPFPGGTVSNYAGGLSPNYEMEIPVKGGAYKYGFSDLKPSRRISTYPTIPSTATAYLGFRCARGAIPDPVFGGQQGVSFDNPVQILTPGLALRIGHPVKVAFVNIISSAQRYLAFIDFTDPDPQVRQFSDIKNVFYPTVSPDGKWVAFSTRAVGFSGTASIFIRAMDLQDTGKTELETESGFIPQWWINPLTLDTTVVFTNSAMDNGSLSDWKMTKTFYQVIRNGKPVGAPITLVDSGGYHDGISTTGRYLVTGYTRLRFLDRETNVARVLFTGPQNGKVAGDTSQVCNLSVSPDSSGNSLFLDFGFEGPNTITGGPYEIHKYAFVSDPLGNILRAYRAPVGEIWEDTKWSNRSRYAASGTLLGESRHYIYALDLQDSVYTRILKGKAIEEPFIWIGSETVANTVSDSIGRYNEPASGIIREHLASKFRPFWYGRDSIGAAFVGHSRVEMGVNPNLIHSVKAFNFGFAGADLQGASRIIRDYLFTQAPNLKVIVLDPMLEFLYEAPIGGDWVWTDQVEANKGYQYDRSHDFWKNGLPPSFLNSLASVPQPGFAAVDSRGWANWWPSADYGWAAKPRVLKGLDWDVSDEIYQQNLQYLKDLVTEISGRGIRIICLVSPQNPAFLKEGSFGLYGPKTETARNEVQTLASWESEIPLFKLYDANNFGDNDFTAEDAYDDSHLNAKGAVKLSMKLDSLLNSILTDP